MRLELTGRHVDITAAIKRTVDSKLTKLERLMGEAAQSAHVVLSREKTFNRVEVTVHLRDEKFLHGIGEGANWLTPLTQAVDRVARQGRTTKGKYQARKRRRGLPKAPLADVLPTGRRRSVQSKADSKRRRRD